MSKVQGPRGTQDVYGREISKWHYLEQFIREMMEVYGYTEVRTPVFEHTEVFVRENDSSDVVNKEMYTFTDRGDRSISLRPEGTAGLIRFYVQEKQYALPDAPHKYFYIGPNFRYERPQKGRLRIHHQFGVEVLGDKTAFIDAEVIGMGMSLVRSLGLTNLKVLINTLGDKESREKYKVALKEHFKPHLESLCSDCKRRYETNPLRILDCKVDKDHVALTSAPKLRDYLSEEALNYFFSVVHLLEDSGITVEIDDRLVRGLDYYSHVVFEVVSTNEAMGSQSTVLAGGRYDELVEEMGGPSISGMGFGCGLERLLIALEAEGVDLSEEDGCDVYCVSLDDEGQYAAYHIANFLRMHGIKAEYDYYGKSFKAQFKTVERKNAKLAILLGEQELANQQLVVKKLDTQEQVTIHTNELLHQIDHWINPDHHHHDDDHEHDHDHDHHHHH